MSIIFDPEKLLRKYAPKSKIKKLITGRLNINRVMLNMFANMDFISKKEFEKVVLKALRHYKKKYKEVDTIKEALGGKELLINRVQNTVIYEIAQDLKEKYRGEKYRWLPSSAETPDPEHQLNYGKIFTVGDGEMPGDRFNCQCGMEILVDENKLEL